jgi:hypothetical protein
MHRLWWFGLLLFGLSACGVTGNEITPESSPVAALPDLGPAPELNNETWLNTPEPLHLADLRGRVVAIDMWTFG